MSGDLIGPVPRPLAQLELDSCVLDRISAGAVMPDPRRRQRGEQTDAESLALGRPITGCS